MYENHYGFTAKPFSIVPNPEFLFLSKNHANALTDLEYGLSEKVGFILLTGEIGAGKTTLIRHMLNQMTALMDIAVIFNTNFSTDQLYSRILSEFEIPFDTIDKERYIDLLYQSLIDRYARGRHALLIIDEAQNLSDRALEAIRMLSNLQTDDHILLQIMLVGQTELKDRLNTPGLRQLAQRIVVNYHLAPLSEKQTHQYIAYRLETAGGESDLFSPEAMQLIYENSSGIPRTINLLCDASLVYGYGDNLKHIDRAAVEKVITDNICLAAASRECPSLPVIDTSPSALKDNLQLRMTAIETALTDLQYRQETILQEVKNELIVAFKELLTAEREGYLEQDREDIPEWHDRHVFTDSALDHATEVETKPHPWEMVEPDPAIEQQSPIGALKSRLDQIHETVFPPLLMFIKKKGMRMATHRYFVWVVLALVPIVGFGYLLSDEKPAPSISISADVDTSPPPTLVAMSYEDAPPPVREPMAIQRKKSTAAATSKKTAATHTIQSGESLSSIALYYGTTVNAIISANNLRDAHLINIGQKLKIPSPPPRADKQ